MRTFVALGIVGVVAITAFATRELSQKPEPDDTTGRDVQYGAAAP